MPDVSSGGLPRPLTSFIGRERELAQARRLLAGSYLVTLTGPGGSGKTRLCIALAAEVAGDYPDGVFFVPLAPVRDPELVPSTIAQSLGLQDARDRPLMDHLVSRQRQPEAACDVFGRCAAMAAELGLIQLTGRAWQMLSYPLLDLGELAAARSALAEGVPVSTEIGDRWIVQIGLGGFIGLAVKTGRPRLALRLAGAADAYRAANEFSMPAPMQEIVDRWLGPARSC